MNEPVSAIVFIKQIQRIDYGMIVSFWAYVEPHTTMSTFEKILILRLVFHNISVYTFYDKKWIFFEDWLDLWEEIEIERKKIWLIKRIPKHINQKLFHK